MGETRCEIQPYIGRGEWGTPCGQPAAWRYVNGAYRRLECESHARITRGLIRYPEDIWLEPLNPAHAAPAGDDDA